MNLKYAGIISALALSAAFAQEPVVAPTEASSAPAAAPAEPVSTSEPAPVAAPAEEVAPAETSAPVEVAAPVENAPVETAPAKDAVLEAHKDAPAVEIGAAPAEGAFVDPAANVAVAPKSVRGSEAFTTSSEQPRAVRGASETTTYFYETVYTGEDGLPVRTVYVTQRPQRDTTTLEDLVGLIPMSFKIGAQGSIGSYYLSGDRWDSDQYDGLTWRAGLMSIIPLNAYTMGVKVGVLFESSEASETYNYEDSNGKQVPVSFRFKQKKIDVPVLFTFKGATSRFFFDLGAQISVPVQDELKLSYTQNGKSIKSKGDMIDDEYRNSMDWSLVFGFSVLANKYVSIDAHADVGLSDHYNDAMDFVNLDLSSSAFTLGITVYPF